MRANSRLDNRLWALPLLSLSFLVGCSGGADKRPQITVESEQGLASGSAAYYEGDYRKALARFAEALQRYQSIDDLDGVLQTRINIAETALLMNNLAQASTELEQISDLLPFVNNPDYQQRHRLLAAEYALRMGNPISTIEQLKILVPIASVAATTQPVTIKALALHAEAAVMAGAEDAPQWLERLVAANLVDSPGYPQNKALLHVLRGRLLIEQGQYPAAIEQAQDALKDYKALNLRTGIARSLELLAQVYRRQQDWRMADLHLRRALPVRAWLTDKPGVLAILTDLVEINQRLQRPQQVQQYQREIERMVKNHL